MENDLCFAPSSGSDWYRSTSEPEVSETVTPTSLQISKKVFITDILECFGEGSWKDGLSATSANFLNRVLALAFSVNPL